MIKSFCAFTLIVLGSSIFAAAQVDAEPTPTPVKLVVTNSLPPPKHISTPLPTPEPEVVVVGQTADVEELSGPSQIDARSSAPIVAGRSARIVPESAINSTARTMAFSDMKRKIAEAKREMQSRPMPTAMADTALSTDWVRIAFHDWAKNRMDYVVISKKAFLSIISDKAAVTTHGRNVTIRTIRGNGVNTPVLIIDESGEKHLPLLVQYPVEKGGRHIETAYYMSTHPGLVTPEVVNAGKFYVHNVIELAREKLKAKGITIQPKVADIAERLALVEHVDHDRFRNEPHPTIFNDVYTLYALNEGQTYRYSVSSAGAGGMVQMIPSTYRMVRSWHPQVFLKPDFVEGMRDHVNASQAMLLYMQRTWNDLIASPTISNALASGIATPEQLMAAGYNSNPARLASYINRGGENWTALIPRETKVYLQIYSSVERHVPMKKRAR